MTHLVLAGVGVVYELILWRELEGLLDALEQVAPNHRHHDVDVVDQVQRLVCTQPHNKSGKKIREETGHPRSPTLSK